MILRVASLRWHERYDLAFHATEHPMIEFISRD